MTRRFNFYIKSPDLPKFPVSFHAPKDVYVHSATGISHEDWDCMKELIKKHNIKSVLEFGPGASTEKFCEAGMEVISLETDGTWAKEVIQRYPSATVFVWDNYDLPDGVVGREFDLAFVDGITPRSSQMRHSIQLAKNVLLHDANRPKEKQLVRLYLSDWKLTTLASGKLAFFERVS